MSQVHNHQIVCPDDRYAEMLEKLVEHQEWGVANVWVVDPHRRALDAYQDGELRTVPRLALAGYPFELSAELFG
jgi:hypothetical protein